MNLSILAQAAAVPTQDVLTFWEACVEPFLWYIVPNWLMNIMATMWLIGDLKGRRRLGQDVPVVSWAVYSFLVGLVLPFVTGPLAITAYYDAKRRRHEPVQWLILATVFSFVGYMGYRVYDNAISRRESGAVWSAGVIVYYLLLLVVFPVLVLQQGWLDKFQVRYLLWIIPSGLGLLFLFPIVYTQATGVLNYATVLQRFKEMGLVADTGSDLVQVQDLKTHFPIRGGVFSTIKGYVKAVDGVSLRIGRGEVVGLVGESGCGKTTVGRTMLGLIEATGGRVLFDGIDLSLLNTSEMRALRAKMQVIFQDPIGSLNPRMTIGGIIGEGLIIHKRGNRAERRERVCQLLERVGLSRDLINRYPHEFSGGQRQRIGIARALALNADFIVCDEPVSALDVSIQAQIINLLRDLQRDFKFSYLFIAHDLAVVEHIADRVVVMYLGKIMEVAKSEELYSKPLHPYTKALMQSIPVAVPGGKKERTVLKGDIPSPVNPPSGCRFRTRCPMAIPACAGDIPPLVDYGNGHLAACIRIKEWVNANS